MKYKHKLIALTLLCAILMQMGCGKKEPSQPVTLPQILPTSNATVPEHDNIALIENDIAKALEGEWVVAGFYYSKEDFPNKKYLIDISDNDALMDLYDTVYLTFHEGGKFVYMNIFNARGDVIQQENGSYLLRTNEEFAYDFTADGLVEKISEDAKKISYLVELIDENTLIWNILDPRTGAAKIDSEPLLFEREDTESDYIRQNKTALNGSDTSSAESSASELRTPTRTAEPAPTPVERVTSGMRNALESAKNYLAVMPFSHEGLIEQLEFEGYTYTEAKYAADHCGANWKQQAVKSAEKYLEIMSFSRSGLIEQLEFEGFTHEEAVYGVDIAY